MTGRFPILYLAEADATEAVMSSGVLAYLVEAMPQARFTVVGSPDSAPLFADTPNLDRLLVLEREGRMEWLGLWSRVRDERWGLVVDMRGSSLSGRLRRQKRAVRSGDEAGLHRVEAAARVLGLDEVPPPRLLFGEETQAAVDALIPPGEGPILAVAPGADWIGRRWPAERYAKVATPLLADDGPLAGGRLMIVGAEDDREDAHTVRFAAPRSRVIELQGRLTPLQTAAALSRADLVMGSDSLWTQLAVASGAPTLGLFGPSDETVRGPWGGASVRGPRSIEELRRIDPRLDQEIQHMMDLPVEPVLKAAKALLERRQAAADGV